MKKSNLSVIFWMLSFFFLSCGDSSGPTNEPDAPQYIEGIHAIVPPSAEFAKEDGSVVLNENSARNVANLLNKVGPGIIEGIGYVQISDEEYQEIKAFTDKLVKGLESVEKVYFEIFGWITSHISYASGYVDNNPYPVFKTHQAICQGYANLLTVMLHSQGIPVFNANGMIPSIGGHAWNYVYMDEWYVSDPTNNGHFLMSDFDKYKHLVPTLLDVDLFEDDSFVYNFYEEKLNIREVKKSGKQLVVPFSVGGFQIGSFNPDCPLPSEVEEIYISKNIESLGENIIGLNIHAPSVKRAYVASYNQEMESYGQVVYRNSLPYYVPASANTIQFKPIQTFGKNMLKDHTGVETVVIQSGTKRLEAYAFEKCPNLKKAYIPEETSVDANAFYDVHPQFEIVRGIVKD